MPLGNPIRKQNESRMISVLATSGQTVFTVQGGYIINHISVFRNGVRLSHADDYTAGDGSTVTLNEATNVNDRIDFHIFDRFTVQNAIVSAASTQTISGDVVVNGKIFGNLDVPSINTGIVTATNLNITGVSTFQNNVHLLDSDRLQIGGSAGTVDGIELYHDGSHSYIQDSGTGELRLRTNVFNVQNAAGDETLIGATENDSVALYFNNNQKLVTTNTGLVATGIVTATEFNVADKIVHTGNSGAAIRFPADNTFTIETGGGEKVRITSGGDLGLGINSPAAKLAIHETSSSSASSQLFRITTANGALFGIETDETVSNPTWKIGGIVNSGAAEPLAFYQIGSEKFRLDSGGRFLIGDATARAQDGGNNAQLQVSSATGGNWARISSSSFTSGDDIGGGLILTKSRSGTVGVHTVVQNGDKIGSIFFEGSDGTDYERGAHIEAFVDGAPGDNDMPGRLVFSTTPDGSVTPAERLRITSSGQLLHGHTASIGFGRNFETSSNSGYGGIAINRFSADTGSGGLDFVKSRNASLGGNTIVQADDNLGAITWRGADGTDFETPAAQIKVAVDGTPGANDMPGRMMFYTTADGASSVSERMRITSSGALLVGTTTTPVSDKCSLRAAYFSNTSSGNVIELTHQTNGADKAGAALGLAISNGGASTNAADLQFKTAISGSLNTRMTIKDSGFVGINETAPDTQLHVTSSSGDTILTLQRSNTNTSGVTGAINFAASDDHSVASIQARGDGDNEGANLLFYTTSAAAGDMFNAANIERLRIAGNGVITNSLATDNTTAVTLRNNGTTGGHALKLTTGGTGAGTHIFTIFSHNQSSENERLRVDANGHLVLGVSGIGNPALYGGRLKVISTAASDAVMNCINTATGGTNRQIDFYFGSNTSRIGSIQSNSSATAYNTSSDYRLKENAVAISDGITRLKTLKPYRFNFKIDASRTVDGFFAHEVTAVPEAITGTKDETEDILYTEEDTIPSGKKVGDVKETVPAYQEIDQSKLVPLLTAALQEAVAKIETLETKVAALEGS